MVHRAGVYVDDILAIARSIAIPLQFPAVEPSHVVLINLLHAYEQCG